jgi:hypothetical protein
MEGEAEERREKGGREGGEEGGRGREVGKIVKGMGV